MKRVVVFTAQIGEQREEVRAPLVIDRAATYLCFADHPVEAPPYQWIPVPSSDTPRLASRAYKILCDHPLLQTAALTLWHDASYRLTRDVEWVRERLRNYDDLIGLPHPKRKRTIEREAKRLVGYGYLSSELAETHIARYRADGFPHSGPVTCGGLLARRQSDRMVRFNLAWWEEVQLWGGRDQVSLDYVAWKSGVVVGHLDGRIRSNPYAQWRTVGELVPA